MSTLQKRLMHVIRDPRVLLKSISNWRGFHLLSDKVYLKMKYRIYMGKKLALEPPISFNEKLQWLKLHDRKPNYSTYVDKYAVRKHIQKTIGPQYLVPLIGVYTHVTEIPWDDLPDQFVLKCTHSSMTNIICRNKQQLDIDASIKQLSHWLKENYYWFGREWPYKNIVPKIICETYLGNKKQVPYDYKVLCFNGKAKLIECHQNRFTTSHTQDFYDPQWIRTSISQSDSFGKNARELVKKPTCLKQMILLSEQLSSEFMHMRIDWFVVADQLYFGEMTFYDGSGFYGFDDHKDDDLLGSWIQLNQTGV